MRGWVCSSLSTADSRGRAICCRDARTPSGQCTDNGALNGRYQAAADPVVRAGTNGMFYYAGLAFDRATSATTASSVSSIFVARYNDLNNNEQLDPIAYIDTHIVASGNSTQFLDKPSMAVDIPRSGAATCSFNANEPGAGPNGGQPFRAGSPSRQEMFIWRTRIFWRARRQIAHRRI